MGCRAGCSRRHRTGAASVAAPMFGDLLLQDLYVGLIRLYVCSEFAVHAECFDLLLQEHYAGLLRRDVLVEFVVVAEDFFRRRGRRSSTCVMCWPHSSRQTSRKQTTFSSLYLPFSSALSFFHLISPASDLCVYKLYLHVLRATTSRALSASLSTNIVVTTATIFV